MQKIQIKLPLIKQAINVPRQYNKKARLLVIKKTSQFAVQKKLTWQHWLTAWTDMLTKALRLQRTVKLTAHVLCAVNRWLRFIRPRLTFAEAAAEQTEIKMLFT